MLFLAAKAADVASKVAENAGEISELSFAPERVLEMLPRMGIGMLVIFVVIGVIILATALINKLFAVNKYK